MEGITIPIKIRIADCPHRPVALSCAGVIRNGIGFDAHRFADGGRLVLGGVEIPHSQGLEGHSDADVLTHALMDAILGAMADGDIGQHFSDRDPRWKNADSIALLKIVLKRVEICRMRVVNIDATVLAEKPRLSCHIPAMRKRLAGALELPLDTVSVKATTVETMGALGRGEGIAVMAIATLDSSRTTGRRMRE